MPSRIKFLTVYACRASIRIKQIRYRTWNKTQRHPSFYMCKGNDMDSGNLSSGSNFSCSYQAAVMASKSRANLEQGNHSSEKRCWNTVCCMLFRRIHFLATCCQPKLFWWPVVTSHSKCRTQVDIGSTMETAIRKSPPVGRGNSSSKGKMTFSHTSWHAQQYPFTSPFWWRKEKKACTGLQQSWRSC
jgi:hypothetical protein